MSSRYVDMEEKEQRQLTGSAWGGAEKPLAAGDLKVGMWLFLGTDALMFATLLSAYGVNRLYNPAWPDAETAFGGLELVSLMTFILITSSATMAAAVEAAEQRDVGRTRLLLGATIAGGLLFLGAQAFEWSHFIATGARLYSNPWGSPLFSASFFVITGFHGFHVAAGVVYLALTLLRTWYGHFADAAIEAAGLYWHFVDLIWVLIFTLFYLI